VPAPGELTLFRAAVAFTLFDAQCLPAAAEELLGRGFVSEALVRLAILGDEPFDPRDARAIGDQAIRELGATSMAQAEAAECAAAVLALQLETGDITPRELTALAAQVVIQADYRTGGDLQRLYADNDYWDEGWSPGNDVIEAEVRHIAAGFLDRFPSLRDPRVQLDSIMDAWPFRRSIRQ
jgi:hypothetical protein